MAEVVEQRRCRELDCRRHLRRRGDREQRRELHVGWRQVVREGQRVEAQVLGTAGKVEELAAGAATAGDGESERALDHESLPSLAIIGAWLSVVKRRACNVL